MTAILHKIRAALTGRCGAVLAGRTPCNRQGGHGGRHTGRASGRWRVEW